MARSRKEEGGGRTEEGDSRNSQGVEKPGRLGNYIQSTYFIKYVLCPRMEYTLLSPI